MGVYVATRNFTHQRAPHLRGWDVTEGDIFEIEDADLAEWQTEVDNGSIAESTLYSAGGTDVAVADGGTGASTAAAARTNLGVSSSAPTVRQPAHLRRWRAALADARHGQPVVTCLGDSITAGAKAQNTTSSTPDALWAQRGWVAQLRDLFAAQWGNCGEGRIRLEDDPRVVLGGGATASSSTGPFGAGVGVTSSQTITITTPPCTDIEIFYWWDNANVSPFTYTVDGSSPVTSPTKDAASQFYTEAITGLVDGSHTLVISGSAASPLSFISGVSCKRASTGVLVHRLGKSGATSATMAGTALSEASQSNVKRAALYVEPAALLVMMIGTNDYLAQSPTPTQFRANIEAFATYQADTMGGCTLLVAGPRRAVSASPPASPTWTQEDYYDEMRELADATDHVAFLDLADLWGTYEDATTLGLMADTSVHPNRAGHGDIARAIHDAITARGLA